MRAERMKGMAHGARRFEESSVGIEALNWDYHNDISRTRDEKIERMQYICTAWKRRE